MCVHMSMHMFSHDGRCICHWSDQSSSKVLSALVCDDLGLDGSYLHADYTVNCDSVEFTWVRNAGIAFAVLWPLGGPLFLGSLLYLYKVPKIAKMKIKKVEQKAFIRYASVLWF